MTSHGSTSVYTGEQLQQFISYAERISFVGGADGYSACIIGQHRSPLLLQGYSDQLLRSFNGIFQ